MSRTRNLRCVQVSYLERRCAGREGKAVNDGSKRPDDIRVGIVHGCRGARAEFSGLASPLTLPRASRPAWLAEEGIVMAGDWEPLLFRARRDNFAAFQNHNGSDRGFAYTPEQLAAYRNEHSPQMLMELKALGVNFIMTHCYKGGGFQAERPGMEDAKRLSESAHRGGMRVGVYVSSGTNMIELIRKEHPESVEWEVLDSNGKPITYGSATYRHYFDRNNPAWQAHLRPIIRYAVEDIKTDLLHFDNYIVGPGFDRNSVERFRQFLAGKYKPSDFGLTDFAAVQPPKKPADDPKLYRAWADFAAYSTAKSLYDMGSYARSLRPDVLMELNAGLDGRSGSPIDLGRILRYSDACWNEVRAPGVGRDGKLQTHIPAYKAAQAMDNIVFGYITCPLEAAESLAYNTDCLGCIAWFEWGKIVDRPGSKQPISAAVLPYVRFFHEQRPYYRDARRIADVAMLRSFASHVFAPRVQVLRGDGAEVHRSEGAMGGRLRSPVGITGSRPLPFGRGRGALRKAGDADRRLCEARRRLDLCGKKRHVRRRDAAARRQSVSGPPRETGSQGRSEAERRRSWSGQSPPRAAERRRCASRRRSA